MHKMYPCPYYINSAMDDSDYMCNPGKMHLCPYFANHPMYDPGFAHQYFPYMGEEEDHGLIKLKDYGPRPFVVNIEEATKQNNNYRTALWTGKHLQLTLMSIEVGGDIGLEIHPDVDQFIRIEEGEGLVLMGNRKDKLDFQEKVYDDYAIFIPAGTWHNVVNTGNKPIKLYSIYAPPQHPKGTVQETKAIAQAAEENHHR